MKKTALITSAALLSLTTSIVLVILTGCEDEPSTGSLDKYFANNPYISDPRSTPANAVLQITPGRASVTTKGEQVHFSVKGGAGPYSWGVAEPANGTITPQGGSSHAIYTVTKIAANNVIVNDTTGHAAIGDITSGIGTVSVSPATATLATNETALVLTASGGTPPYAWAIASSPSGSGSSVSAAAGKQSLYTRTAGPTGTAVVSVTDEGGAGTSAFATLTLE